MFLFLFYFFLPVQFEYRYGGLFYIIYEQGQGNVSPDIITANTTTVEFVLW